MPRADAPDPAVNDEHLVIEPTVLYVGTPVYLVVTENADGTANLAPASSHWALGRMLVLGLEADGQSAQNLLERPQLTVNFPAAKQWREVERLSAVTGRDPVPDAKADQYRFEPRKFELAGFSAQPSDLVSPPRVREAPLQFEGRVRCMTPGVDAGYFMVEVEVVRVHALPELNVPGTQHVDPHAWHPLIYSFRHFFDRGEQVGWTRKSPTAASLPDVSGRAQPEASRVARTPLEELERWESFGGTWALRELTDDGAIVSLCRCDGGEEVSRIVSADPAFVSWAAEQEVQS
ncbi:flavin reductase family protein [Agromyces sp. H3Y2-19a]|uniref:flavin reductase family protein n=1 Tax=Agromyces chromiiresistens TaxID=3030835 RepID=UPI0023B8CFF2|nr:flavin reductase family protein [Agromyces chromiiresistens]MDF0513470.1 flavin reductase family protein [Agromyces chromiiresistens]